MSDKRTSRLPLARLSIRLKFTLVFYLVTLLSTGIVGYSGYTNTATALQDKAAAQVRGYTNKINEQITAFLELTRGDLGFFAASNDLLRHLYWKDLGEKLKAEHWKSATTNSWQDFVSNYNYIYRVRFLDLKGQEQIVIRRDPLTRSIRTLEPLELQDKSNRSYFQKATTLDKGEISVAPMSLNREHGKIEKPHVPVVRIAQGVFGENGVRYGVLVINLFADAFFDYIRQSNQQITNGHFYLINRQGDFLFHPDAGKSFAQLLGHHENFKDYFPDVMELLLQAESGTTFSQNHVLAFKRIYPHPGSRNDYWILVGTVDEQGALAELAEFNTVFLAILAIVVILVFLASRLFLRSILTPLMFVTRQLQRLSQGNAVKEGISYHSNDEIRQMLDSTDQLIANMETVATQADVISRGDFSGTIRLLSENDRLGTAINNMTEMLRGNKQESDRRNWLKDGIGQLNQTLSGNLEPRELANLAISGIGRHLDAGRGVFYVNENEGERLTLLGSYMYTERESLSAEFRPGEGAIGQVALEKTPIALTHIRADEAPITSGTASGPPLYTYTFPLLHEEELLGVIELAAFQPFNELQREFLDSAAHTISGFFSSVMQQRKIRDLLHKAEQAATEAREQRDQLTLVNQQMEQQQLQLQQQTEKLQQANTQMEEQQQQLQQQTEELQQTNAQMEEQQQQLQQQTEELQQTNAQMEEQQQQLQQQALEMEEKNSALEISKDELDQRAMALEQASRYKSEFLANMSHELRTPLNSIILLSKMLAMNDSGNLCPDEEKRAGVIHQAGEELLRLINDILDLSKIEAGKMELNIQEVSIDGLLEEFRDLFGETAQSTGLDFSAENRLPDITLFSDRDKLAQVIRNLLSNAFKFTKEGQVELIVAESGQDDLPVRISVKDSGIGIPEGKRQQVFEAFQQADGSVSREFGGTGLGLSISMRFAKLLGGHIALESEEGRGSTFSVLLPLTIDENASTEKTLPRGDPAVDIEATPANLKRQPEIEDDRQNLKSSDSVILVVDDDLVFAESITLLNRKLGYKTLIARDGEEGLRMARTYRPEGILLDLGLPDIDGSEVLRQLKSTRELRRIPVYIVSARDKEENLLKQGIAGYLQKPVDYDQLANAEALVVEKAKKRAGDILVVEGPTLSAAQIAKLIKEERLGILSASDLDSALDSLADNPALAVVDIGHEQQACLRICRELKDHDAMLPIILYGDRQPGAEEEAQLAEFSDSLIINTPQADQRILNNIERFLQSVPDHGEGQSGALSGVRRADSVSLKGRRILVVDDDPRNLFVITSALEQAGAAIDTALNGAKALERLQETADIDMVFMDIMMPEMDGYEAIQAIKNNDALKHIPVVALTAKALRADKEKALSVGADDYLSKPVDYEVLINMAAVWCENKQ